MAIALQVFEERLLVLEREIADLKAEMARWRNSTGRGARLVEEAQGQHATVAAAWDVVRERLGIKGQPIGAKGLRQKLIAAGVNQSDNAFSHELIAMREE